MAEVADDNCKQKTSIIPIPENLGVSVRISQSHSFITKLQSSLRRLLGQGDERRISYPEKYGKNLYDLAYGKLFEEKGIISITEEFRPIIERVQEIIREFPYADASERAKFVEELETLEHSLHPDIEDDDEAYDYYHKPGLEETLYVIKRAMIFPPIKFERFRRMVRTQSLGLQDKYSSYIIISKADIYFSFKREIEMGKYSYDELFTNKRELIEMDKSLRKLFSEKYSEAKAKELASVGPSNLLPPGFSE
ncbi:MAG: hypothetical protein V1808_01700 [Candidatus Daviesbacteria bacterium]